MFEARMSGQILCFETLPAPVSDCKHNQIRAGSHVSAAGLLRRSSLITSGLDVTAGRCFFFCFRVLGHVVFVPMHVWFGLFGVRDQPSCTSGGTCSDYGELQTVNVLAQRATKCPSAPFIL